MTKGRAKEMELQDFSRILVEELQESGCLLLLHISSVSLCGTAWHVRRCSLVAERLAPWSKNLKVAGSRLHRDLIYDFLELALPRFTEAYQIRWMLSWITAG